MRRWAANLTPPPRGITIAFLDWRPKATYPDRQGRHDNSAFGCPSVAVRPRPADRGAPALPTALSADRWFDNDVAYPAALGVGRQRFPVGRAG